MLQTFKNAWKVEELRKKIIFTAIILVIFRLGCAIAVPFVKPDALQGMLSAGDGRHFNVHKRFVLQHTLACHILNRDGCVTLKNPPHMNCVGIVEEHNLLNL